MIYDGIILKPSMDEILEHHGIKGQQWGVQNGPPYPLDKGRKQTKYGFKGKGGNARKVSKVLANTSIIPIAGAAGLVGAVIADARSVSYKPGETTDKHYIKKGTKMYRVSSVDKENNIGETYVTYNPVDRAFYRAYIKSKNPDQKVYETTFKANQDLVVPSQKELAEVQKKVIWDNPKLKKQSIEGFSNFRSFGDYRKEKIDALKNDYDSFNKVLKGKAKVSDIISYKPVFSNVPSENGIIFKTSKGKEIMVDMGTLSKYNATPKTLTNAYKYDDGTRLKKQILSQVKNQDISQFSVVSLSMGTSKDLKQAMIKELKKRGYNSMVDEAGIGALEVPGVNDKKSGQVSREGVEPIIVFDRSESLKAIKTKEVKDTSSDINYYERWRNHKDNAYRQITW